MVHMNLQELTAVLALEQTLITYARQCLVTVSLTLALLILFVVHLQVSKPIFITMSIVSAMLIVGALVTLALAIRDFDARMKYLPTDIEDNERKRSRPIVYICVVIFLALTLLAGLICVMGLKRVLYGT